MAVNAAPAAPEAGLAPAARWNRQYAIGAGLVALAGLFWSLAGVLIRNIEAATSWQIVFYRAAALVVTLSLVLLFRHRRRTVMAFRAVGLVGLVAGACIAIASTAFIVSVLHTTVANSLFILASAPFFAAVLGWVLLQERVRAATWAAITVALAGVGVMVAEGLAGGGLFGNLMALVTALAFAGVAVTLRYGRAVDMLPVVCVGGVIAGTVAALMADDLAVSLHDLVLCTIMGSVQIGAGMIALTLGSRRVPAAEIGLLSMTEVVVGPIWVWLAVDEVPSLLTLAGGGLVICALVAQAIFGLRAGPPES